MLRPYKCGGDEGRAPARVKPHREGGWRAEWEKLFDESRICIGLEWGQRLE